jgi:hypothetical protein
MKGILGENGLDPRNHALFSHVNEVDHDTVKA